MPSDVSICNAALIKINATVINSLNDNVEAARLCKHRFGDILDLVLRRFPWNCAMSRVELPAESSTPSFEWAYQHVLPVSPFCLRVIDEYSEYEFKIEGRKVLSNQTPLQIRYIKRIKDISEIDPLLAEAVSCYLAMELAMPLLGSATLKKAMKADYKDALKAAKGADGDEGTPTFKNDDGSWLTRRGGNG